MRRTCRTCARRREAVGRPVGVLADLQGPKIRLGRFASGKEMLVNGATFTITVDDIQGTVDRCSTTYKGLPGDVSAGRPDLDRRRPDHAARRPR